MDFGFFEAFLGLTAMVGPMNVSDSRDQCPEKILSRSMYLLSRMSNNNTSGKLGKSVNDEGVLSMFDIIEVDRFEK